MTQSHLSPNHVLVHAISDKAKTLRVHVNGQCPATVLIFDMYVQDIYYNREYKRAIAYLKEGYENPTRGTGSRLVIIPREFEGLPINKQVTLLADHVCTAVHTPKAPFSSLMVTETEPKTNFLLKPSWWKKLFRKLFSSFR